MSKRSSVFVFLYEDFFPMKNGREAYTSFNFLMSEWFLLKWLIAASIELKPGFTEDGLVNIVYSYHSITRHDQYAEDAFLAEIEKLKIKDNISLVYLLK
ncbi:hypothetical protein JQ729_25620 [Klebsiella quasipneumoniae subsp. similipneumoniae]|nr:MULTISPECIES: hypothetical protein [Klebsiella]MCJ1846954.1 hypothetical protein [Klebsiella quasipneumoniae subsp. similipneumoniae]HBM3023200.1 hypothetical protein [Klebsiella michiganensis]MCP3439142.1 hypothetical protein [Klebsiella variicola]PXK03292.1 hypothetical protein DMR34_29655 [Klebsiella variicola]HCC7083518.1 hypothetical protein [Klebsiella michiganensis]